MDHLHSSDASSYGDASSTSLPAVTTTPELSLVQLLWEEPSGRLRLMEDCCRLIDQEVGARRGLKGATLRAGYGAVRRLKPGIIGYVVGKLAPEGLEALEPFFVRVGRSTPAVGARPAALRALLVAEDVTAARALLSLTDRLIRKARAPIQIAYGSLRSEAAENVRVSMPAIAELLERRLTERLAARSVACSQDESSSSNARSTGPDT